MNEKFNGGSWRSRASHRFGIAEDIVLIPLRSRLWRWPRTMILRTYIECPACDAPILLRVGVVRDRQPISVACPECQSIIRGSIIEDNNGYPRYSLPGVTILDPKEDREWNIISTYGDLPMNPAAEGFSSGFLALYQVFGDHFEKYLRSAATARWFGERADAMEFAYGFYLKGEWSRLDSAMQRSFEDFWMQNPTVIERNTLIHRLTFLATTPLDPGGMYPYAKEEVWSRIFKKEKEFSEAALGVVEDPAFAITHKRIAYQFTALLRAHADWAPALAVIHVRSAGLEVPSTWQVPAGNFDSLRDAYRQNFELSCQALHLVMRMQNISEGRISDIIRDSADVNSWMPRTLRPLDYVNNINQFNRSNAATKEAYLNRHSRLRYFWNAAFSRSVRNAIAHADFDYSAHDGIVIQKGEAAPYFTFLEALIKQICLLGLWLDLFKLYKMYASCWDARNQVFRGL
jgi:hypothetical protein